MIKQIIVSRSCSHVCPTLPRTPVSGPAPIWLHWKKSDKSWGKNWRRCTFHLNGLRQSPKFWSLSVLSSKAADVQLVDGKEEGGGGGGWGCDSHSPTNPRCAAASCQRTQVCEECLECRTNLLEHFPFKCPVEQAAGRLHLEICTKYF